MNERNKAKNALKKKIKEEVRAELGVDRLKSKQRTFAEVREIIDEIIKKSSGRLATIQQNFLDFRDSQDQNSGCALSRVQISGSQNGRILQLTDNPPHYTNPDKMGFP